MLKHKTRQGRASLNSSDTFIRLAPVRVKTVGPKEYRQTRVECTNNPDQHWWEFDRTILGDVGEDYRNNHQ